MGDDDRTRCGPGQAERTWPCGAAAPATSAAYEAWVRGRGRWAGDRGPSVVLQGFDAGVWLWGSVGGGAWAPCPWAGGLPTVDLWFVRSTRAPEGKRVQMWADWAYCHTPPERTAVEPGSVPIQNGPSERVIQNVMTATEIGLP